MALETVQYAPSDFDFAVGDWRVKHRRLKDRLVGSDHWTEFDGSMSTQKILGGYGNVEDNLLRLPEGEYRAVAVRSFDPQTHQWSIWWLDGRFPGKMDIPVVGQFNEQIGTFYAEDVLNGTPIRVRFIWWTRDPQNPRWEQAFSEDGGATWETNWTMEFSRA
ncbi:DUF1579 domain-containing protein [Acidovorax sp. SRB_14]|uniref:DUF1579 domain-containing protein n=1 Tax=unclassified Acidovorax TaxID=2684926 RepID=UPI00145C62A6|nr:MULTISPECIES: DUF1579 domain-containing protein [unclassified Acidovorax]NMM76495.1 DUF1579 domain-containing protein [Acidovorax sp. SRB_24]NMM79534.1 DUF1579 domain-containing protein [Acidovorax sp. SRB_14]NMM90271.1 DUF1579 domain-containing protein [Rhodococcus sp. SRB_17]